MVFLWIIAHDVRNNLLEIQKVISRVTSGTGTVSHYGEQTLGTLRLNARADGIGAEYLIIYRGN